MSSWSEFDIIDGASAPRLIDQGITAIEALGAYGLNALTAYFGLMRVGRPRPGETMVVSGAAGSTGSVAAQIGRIAGCRVIGIAGGAEKCSWLRDECRIADVIDYRSDDVSAALKSLCPTGIDIFYDNVGGVMLQAAVDNMAKFGRIILCGQIAGYNNEEDLPAFRNIMRVIYGSVRLQGFLFGDYRDEIPEAMADLIAWRRSGEIVTREDIRTGFETLPMHFNALLKGPTAGPYSVSLMKTPIVRDDRRALWHGLPPPPALIAWQMLRPSSLEYSPPKPSSGSFPPSDQQTGVLLDPCP